MAKGGTIRKHVGDGLEWTAAGENAPTFTKGGWYNVDYEETNNEPFVIADKISGSQKGIELQLSQEDFITFDKMAQKSAVEKGGVSWLTEMPDGTKWTAKGGAYIVPSGAADGMFNLRDGKVSIDVIPVKGSWIPA